MKQRILMTALTSAILSACGGGGSDGDPQSTSITFSGTAATGAAIVGGQVEVKCAAGSGNTTTIADGTYTVTLSGAALPCVMRVTSGSTQLYSLAQNGNGSAVRSNITPFSHMVAAKAVGGSLGAFYTNFSVSDQAKLDSSTVASAISAVTAALSGTADFAGVNPITGTFIVGDAFDQQLDAFKAALDQARVTLDEVTSAVVAGGTTPAPVRTLLQPASTSCAGLRSGKYRVINPHEVAHDADYITHLITVDAAALTVTDDLDATHTALAITPDADTACRFTLPGDHGTATLLVSPSGLSFLLAPNSTAQTQVSAVIPEQTIPVSELAGTWNHLAYEQGDNTTSFVPVTGTTTINDSGQETGGTDCTGLDTCQPLQAPFGTFVSNPAGGFTYDGAVRAFAFKNASGGISAFLIDTSDGSIAIATKQVALSLPDLASVSDFWDFSIGSNGLASALTNNTVTITAVNAVAQSYTRERASDGRVDGFTSNTPRNGLRYRAAGTSPINGGGSVNFSEIVTMPLPGTGVGVYVSVGSNQNFFGISVNKP